MNGSEFFSMIAGKTSFGGLHPDVAAFFKTYLSHEKAIEFDGRYVVNTHFPPYPSRAFDSFAGQFTTTGNPDNRQLYSVTLAVTNRCGYRCWHCYNAGRSTDDLPLCAWEKIAVELTELHTVNITLSGGEPLLRDDLEAIAGLFADRSNIVINTTGYSFTGERAAALKEAGVFGVGISLDSHIEEIHDRLRGKPGAFGTALKAIGTARDNHLYPYVIAVVTPDLLEEGTFESFLGFAADNGALEIHLLEPCPTGNLSGNTDALLDERHRTRILDYQERIARRDDLPILSSFMYLESPEAFGCGAGLTHLYIDGTGEVCPCNFVPLSFGNAAREKLTDILGRMGEHFRKPRTCCVGHVLAECVPPGKRPTDPVTSSHICREHLPADHDIPKFFAVRSAATGCVGKKELEQAYDGVHSYYDEFWVSEAGKPVIGLIDRLSLKGNERIFEAGCGTGYATTMLAGHLNPRGSLTAVDISGGMIGEAKKRFGDTVPENVTFVAGDALEKLEDIDCRDVIFSSWVLGYIPLAQFFTAVKKSLADGGVLGFIVHRKNSPSRETGIFGEIIAEDPSALTKQVDFDFPIDAEHLRQCLESAGLHTQSIEEGSVVFRYDTPERVLEHLLKSGAGTAFYEAVAAVRRAELEKRFLKILGDRNPPGEPFDVVHDYLSCVAVKPDCRTETQQEKKRMVV